MKDKRMVNNDWDEFIAFLENNQREYLEGLKRTEGSEQQVSRKTK